jgi:hypothetical protein
MQSYEDAKKDVDSDAPVTAMIADISHLASITLPTGGCGGDNVADDNSFVVDTASVCIPRETMGGARRTCVAELVALNKKWKCYGGVPKSKLDALYARHHDGLTVRMPAEISEEDDEETEVEEEEITEKDLVFFPEDHEYHETRVINLKTYEVYNMDDVGEIDTEKPIEGVTISNMTINRYIK